MVLVYVLIKPKICLKTDVKTPTSTSKTHGEKYLNPVFNHQLRCRAVPCMPCPGTARHLPGTRPSHSASLGSPGRNETWTWDALSFADLGDHGGPKKDQSLLGGWVSLSMGHMTGAPRTMDSPWWTVVNPPLESKSPPACHKNLQVNWVKLIHLKLAQNAKINGLLGLRWHLEGSSHICLVLEANWPHKSAKASWSLVPSGQPELRFRSLMASRGSIIANQGFYHCHNFNHLGVFVQVSLQKIWDRSIGNCSSRLPASIHP